MADLFLHVASDFSASLSVAEPTDDECIEVMNGETAIYKIVNGPYPRVEQLEVEEEESEGEEEDDESGYQYNRIWNLVRP